jgi:hypothetical protein
MYLVWETRTLISKQSHYILKAEVTKHNRALNVPSPTRPLLHYVPKKILSCYRPVVQHLSLQSLAGTQYYHGWSNTCSVRILISVTNCWNMFVPTVQSQKNLVYEQFCLCIFHGQAMILTRFNYNTELQIAYGSLPINLGLTRWWHLCH